MILRPNVTPVILLLLSSPRWEFNFGDELDDDLTAVIDMGYLSINKDGGIEAEASAYTMVSFLDAMFPGMQGMNLVAYVMQDER